MTTDKRSIPESNKSKLLQILISEKTVTSLTILLTFLISFFYLYIFGNYLFHYQENISLFVFSDHYFHLFLTKPGGLLQYTGNFLSQGYGYPMYGSLILSLFFTLLVIALIKINRKLNPERTLSYILVLLPSCLLLLTQLNFNWAIWNNIGILLSVSYFLLSLCSGKKEIRILILMIFPLFYYFAGLFAWVFVGIYTIYNLSFNRGRKRFVYPAILISIALLTLILSKKYVFIQPMDVLLYSPFSLQEQFVHQEILYMLAGFVIFYPLLIKFSIYIKARFKPDKFFPLTSVLATFFITAFFLLKWYDPKIARLFEMEQSVYNQDWDDVIRQQETQRLSNIVAEYYYNLALAEKGQLCDRMFFGPQNFGTKSLMVPWDSKGGINNLDRGIYFFYTVGLINEAHRWAYESLVVQGYRPENLKLLVKTDLINGHYKTARKYINILKKTFRYRSWAKKYESMLNHPELILSDPELSEKRKIFPEKDFQISIRNPQSNLFLLLNSNPGNKVAFEYLLAWFMLEKNIDALAGEVSHIKDFPYSKLPRHVEEALLIYKQKTGSLPDFGTLKISEKTINRFSLFNRFDGPAQGIQKKPYDNEKNSFWFYYYFK